MSAADPLDSLDKEYDELYAKAVAHVKQHERASSSMLRREFKKMGAVTALEILEQMQKEGIVGPASGNGVREVFAGQPA
jgi:S-DNA-T family DNA segregation ATPase FtsK/SpoIIIE